MENRGSEWRKWDLHVHTPYTHLNKYQSTDDEFISQIIKENISVIGLTNYFKFTEEEYVLKKKLEEKGVVVFLNLEIRLTYQNKEDDCCDLHIIFDKDLSVEKIKDFLSNLTLSVNGNPIKAKDISNVNDGFKKAVVEFKDLTNTLKDESLGLANKYLIGFLSRGKGNARSSSVYETIAKEADLLIHSSDSEKSIIEDHAFWESQGKPLLQTSDAHNLDKIGTKFTWIKAVPVFEGLIQIKYEPTERVRIQDEKPDKKSVYNTIDSIQFTTVNNGFFTNKKIFLNPNLNTIIGGKSTGKSNLLRKIAKTIDKTQYAERTDKNLDWITQDLSIEWCGGDNTDKKILYIPQSFLIKDIEDRKDISKIIETALKGDKSRYKLYEDLEAYQHSIQNTISAKVDDLFENGRQQNLKEEKLRELGNKHGIQEQINKLQIEKIQLLKDLKIEEKEIEKLKDNQKKSEGYKNELSNLAKDSDILKSKIEFLGKYNDKILIEEKDFFINENIRNQVNTFYHEKNEEAFKLVVNFIELKLLDISKTNDTLNKAKDLVDSEILESNTKIQKQTFIEKIDNEIVTEQQKLKDREQLEKEIKLIVKSSQEIIDNIFIEFDKFYFGKESFVKGFTFNEDSLEIGYKLSTAHNSVFEWVKDNAINLKTSYCVSINEGFKNPINIDDYDTFLKCIKFFFIEAITNKIPFKYGHNSKSFIKKLLEDWFSLKTVMNYEGDPIEHMSDGKKAFVLLKLLINIDNSSYPIIIDQPEDSLDNRSIYNELTTYIKEKKRIRQIIIVTHNANLVVGADAENIIVANQHGNNSKNKNSVQFDYINGALEETKALDNKITTELERLGIKEHICSILEGGKLAFNKRKNKYNLN